MKLKEADLNKFIHNPRLRRMALEYINRRLTFMILQETRVYGTESGGVWYTQPAPESTHMATILAKVALPTESK